MVKDNRTYFGKVSRVKAVGMRLSDKLQNAMQPVVDAGEKLFGSKRNPLAPDRAIGTIVNLSVMVTMFTMAQSSLEAGYFARMALGTVGTVAAARSVMSNRGAEIIEGENFSQRFINAIKNPDKHMTSAYMAAVTPAFGLSLIESIANYAENPEYLAGNLIAAPVYAAITDHFVNNRQFKENVQNKIDDTKLFFTKAKVKTLGVAQKGLQSLEVKYSLGASVYGAFFAEGLSSGDKALQVSSAVGVFQNFALYAYNKSLFKQQQGGRGD